MRIHGVLSISLLCVTLGGVASCGKTDDSAASILPASATSGQAELQADLEIVGFGPHGTQPGKAFNVQSSGQSALWLKLNHPAAGSGAAIWWGSHQLDSSVSGDVISAFVPAQLYANAGRYPLLVRVKGGDASGTVSNTVYFVVK